MSILGLCQKIKNWFLPKKRQEGAIKFFDRKKRFGFIIASENEYFFHAAALRGGDFRYLQDGTKVTFVLIQGRKGPQADDIVIIAKTKNNHFKS